MPGRGAHRPGPPDHLLRGAAEVALAVARRRSSDDPAVPAPRRLTPFLDFTRLPDRALAAFRQVLDEDEELRRATRHATDEDSVGRASWLFLDRPEGWEDELDLLAGAAGDAQDQREEADARRRLEAVEAAHRRVDQEVARLARELGDAKEQLAIERRARRRAESEAGRQRRRSAELASEIDEHRRTASELRSALEEARAEADGPTGGEEAIADRARTGAAGAPGDARSEGSPAETVDEQALSETLEGAISAAEILSAALAEAARLLAPVVTPPDGPPTSAPGPDQQDRSETRSSLRRRPVALPPGTFDDSVAAAEHLLRVGQVLVLVDGYNVTKLARPELGLSEQRGWLVDAAVELAARSGAHLELIFDGTDERGSAPADLGRRMGVQVRFSPDGTEADDLLLDLVAVTPVERPVVVASDDRRVQHGARRLGANVITSRQLLAVVRRPM